MEKLTELLGDLSGTPIFNTHTQTVRGKRRHISVPNDAMRELHAKLLTRLMQVPDRSRRDGRSSHAKHHGSNVKNARYHRSARYVYQVDLRNAYGSVPLPRLTEILHSLDPRLGDKGEIALFLWSFCSDASGGLTTGGPASPALFDLYCRHAIDIPLEELWHKGDIKYARYVDDLTISSHLYRIPSILRKRIRAVVEEAGFVIHHGKSKVVDCTVSEVTITGVVIRSDGSIRPTARFMEKFMAHLRASTMTTAEVASFLGCVQYLKQFKEEFYERASPDDLSTLLVRAKRKIGRLTKEGLIPRRSSGSKREIPKEFIERLRDTAPLDDFVGRYVLLKKHGRELAGLSPFTKEKTPSFFVNVEKRFYHCFSCGKHGDIFEFAMEMERISFTEAVKLIASLYDVPLPHY